MAKTTILQNPPRRLLFVRLDRIGDLVLTLPVDEALPEAEVHWWIPQGLSFVTRSARPRRHATETPRRIDFREFLRCLREVRSQRYDAAVVFHAPWWVSCLLWLARIPIRAGVRSQWHSFLFLNRATRQKRSRAEHSELEYNFRLLEAALGAPTGALTRHHLKLIGWTGPERQELLERHGLQEKGFSVVHPGMGGSALNWPTGRYAEWIGILARREPVAVTGTAGDEPYLAPLRELFKSDPRVIWLDKKLSGPELITVLSAARSVTAPSTGVMHLAASTGVPTLGIFSPVRVQHPRRWGPQGPRQTTILPKLQCPGELSCIGSACPNFHCMEKLTSEEADRALKELSNRTALEN